MDRDAAKFKRLQRKRKNKKGPVVKPNLEPRSGTKVGLHYSSNLESLVQGKLQDRPLGFSVGRRPAELLSSPTLAEPKGTKGLALVKIKGKGLDVSRPDDMLGIEKLTSEATRRRSKGENIGIDTQVIKELRKRGVDYVDNWAGFGGSEAEELHIINQPKAKVLKTVPISQGLRGPMHSDVGLLERIGGKMAKKLKRRVFGRRR